jgi:hypothetical protein
MGLGKTVQIAAFLMAVFGKSGLRSVDAPVCRRRSRDGYGDKQPFGVGVSSSGVSAAGNAAGVSAAAGGNAAGGVSACGVSAAGASTAGVLNPLLRPPCLVIVPASVCSNWHQELTRWGYFLVSTLDDKTSSLATIEAAREGRLEVVLGSYQRMEKYASELAAVTWSVVIWDEGEEKSMDYYCLVEYILLTLVISNQWRQML